MTRPSTQDAFGANFVTCINTPEEEGEQRGEGEAARRHQVYRDFTITEKAPSRAFSWLMGLLALSHLRHYAERTGINPQLVDMQLGPQCKGHKGRVVWSATPFDICVGDS